MSHLENVCKKNFAERSKRMDHKIKDFYDNFIGQCSTSVTQETGIKSSGKITENALYCAIEYLEDNNILNLLNNIDYGKYDAVIVVDIMNVMHNKILLALAICNIDFTFEELEKIHYLMSDEFMSDKIPSRVKRERLDFYEIISIYYKILFHFTSENTLIIAVIQGNISNNTLSLSYLIPSDYNKDKNCVIIPINVPCWILDRVTGKYIDCFKLNYKNESDDAVTLLIYWFISLLPTSTHTARILWSYDNYKWFSSHPELIQVYILCYDFDDEPQDKLRIKFRTGIPEHKLGDRDKLKIVEFKENTRIMNGGVYFFNKTIFKNIKNKNISLEDDIIEKAIRNHQVKGFYSDNFFLDIGTKKNLLLAKKKIPSYFYRPGIFLDRDGTINEDKGYVYKIEYFILKKKIKKALEFFSQNNFYLFIVTNQAGIGHGFYKIKDFIKLHEFIKYNFIKKNIYINEVKFCPYHPKAKIKRFRRRSSFRKPNNSMINEILRDWDVNIKRSLMIGDKKIDQQCAQRSKLKFIYYSKNIFSELRKKIKIH